MAATAAQARQVDSPLSDWYPLAEAAQLAGVSRSLLHQAATAGEIDSSPTRLGRLFHVSAVREWAQRRKAGMSNVVEIDPIAEVREARLAVREAEEELELARAELEVAQARANEAALEVVES